MHAFWLSFLVSTPSLPVSTQNKNIRDAPIYPSIIRDSF